MFRVENNVPEVYVNNSRDFQLFCRLFDLVVHSSRFSTNLMENTSNSSRCGDTLLPLLGTKVGMFNNLDVPDDIYRKILDAFPVIMRYKGSIKGYLLLANLFEHICNTEIAVEYGDDGDVKFLFQDYSSYFDVFETLIEYIRPAGTFVTYQLQTAANTSTSYSVAMDVEVHSIKCFDVENGEGMVQQSRPKTRTSGNIINTLISRGNDYETDGGEIDE